MDNPQKLSLDKGRPSANDFTSLNGSQLNNSVSKMQYTIPKSQRWTITKEQRELAESKFYQLPSIRSNRATSLGYGNKTDISKLFVETPAPSAYKIKSDFTRKSNEGITLSAGRDIIKANSVFANKPFPVPGPQDYDVKYPYSSVRMSMRSKLTDLSDRWVLSVPGPGAYQTVEMLDSQLKSRISGFPSVRNGKFDRSARKSEEQIQTRVLAVPGPGQYSVENSHQMVSKFPRNKGPKFSQDKRKGIVEDSITPGPGQYHHFSQFIH